MTTLQKIIGRIPESNGTAVPTEFQLLPFGQVQIKGSENPLIVDEDGMRSASQAFADRGLDMVIDYEHQTLGKTKDADFSSPNGQAPAAGWIRALEPRGREGLWAKVEWTEKAREYLARREYRYFSPVLLMSKSTGRLLSIENVGLTNAPRLNAIKPIVAKNSNVGDSEMDFLKLVAKQLGMPETATLEQVLAKVADMQKEGSEFLKLSAKECGLSEASTADQVIASIRTIPARADEAKEIRGALDLKEESSKSEVIASIHALRQRPDATVVQEIASLKARIAERDRDDLVAAALKEGKITPAQKEWAEKYALADAEGFRLFVAKAPQVVPIDGSKIIGDKAGQSLDDAQLQINKMLGISEDTWKKHNPPAQA